MPRHPRLRAAFVAAAALAALTVAACSTENWPKKKP